MAMKISPLDRSYFLLHRIFSDLKAGRPRNKVRTLKTVDNCIACCSGMAYYQMASTVANKIRAHFEG